MIGYNEDISRDVKHAKVHIAMLMPRVEGPRRYLKTRRLSIRGIVYQAGGLGVMRLTRKAT
jgi:hypothetical protein